MQKCLKSKIAEELVTPDTISAQEREEVARAAAASFEIEVQDF